MGEGGCGEKHLLSLQIREDNNHHHNKSLSSLMKNCCCCDSFAVLSTMPIQWENLTIGATQTKENRRLALTVPTVRVRRILSQS